jgi:hypothetical protein
MDDFELLEDYFNHLVDKKIIGVGVLNDELYLKLEDGSIVTFFNDGDDDLSMNITYTN